MQAKIEPLENRLFLTAAPLTLDGGDTLAEATQLGRVSGQVVLDDNLSTGEGSDFFSFSVRATGSVNVTLDHLASNANLRLFNSNGQQIAISGNLRTRSELISKTLKRGTYFVSVDRGRAAPDTAYEVTIQADTNYAAVDIGGDTFNLSLTQANGSSTAIIPTRETWVVIHGWLSSPKATQRLANAIQSASRRIQVLQLNWSEVAKDVNPFTVIFNVPDVGQWAADKLTSWGIAGSSINLVGHSYGGYMTDIIARDISGGVDRIVALDPATVALGGIDFSGTNYAAHSLFSLAMIGSDKGTVSAAQTADEILELNVGDFSGFTAHDNVKELFATMTQLNNTSKPGPISPLFSLRSLHAGLRPNFKPSAIDSDYDALLTGKGNGSSIVPTQLTYIDQTTGNTVTIK